MEKTRILIFTGNGKGKTTAALGMALRAGGHGMRVKIIQFIKADASTGEVGAIRNLPDIELVQTGKGFLPPPGSPAFAEHRQAAERGLRLAADDISSGRYDLLVLDELCTAVALGLLEERAVLDTIGGADRSLIIVLTGRGATAGLIALADTVTEMVDRKHAGDNGLPAQKGVEF